MQAAAAGTGRQLAVGYCSKTVLEPTELGRAEQFQQTELLAMSSCVSLRFRHDLSRDFEVEDVTDNGRLSSGCLENRHVCRLASYSTGRPACVHVSKQFQTRVPTTNSD